MCIELQGGQYYESKLCGQVKLLTSFLVLLPDFITEIFLHGCDIESGRPGNEVKKLHGQFVYGQIHFSF